MTDAASTVTDFPYEPTIQLGADTTTYREIDTQGGVEVVEAMGRTFLRVEPRVLTKLAYEAFHDISFYLRPAHLQQIARELDDPEATDNDRFVLYTLLQNAVTAAHGELPSCQDTGTATIVGKKGQHVLTDGKDAEHLSRGVYEAWQTLNLRYSQIAPLETFKEANTRTNLPAQIDLYAEGDDAYKLLFVAKGGGSANKMFLYQQTPAVLNERDLLAFLSAKLKTLGTSACPPYHIAICVGGTSAEACLKHMKMASAGEYDALPTSGSEGGRAFRDLKWEQKVLQACWDSGIGAQFGGKYFAHDVRFVRMPRHAASCPIALGVSCSADRNVKAKVTAGGVFLEQLERKPERYLPDVAPELAPAVKVDLNMGMDKVREVLSKFPVRTRLSLSGSLIVARDAAHARIREMLERGEPMPAYFKEHPIYYAGPAKTPEGMASGSFGPTTAGRMDPFTDLFQGHGGSLVMIAKGNRSRAVTDACKAHGGFYLGSIGGPAAILAQSNITNVELVDFEELGMEAVRRIDVKDFPAFIVVDDKGNDFFAEMM